MSSVIFYWIARFLQNLKFYVVINNLIIDTLMQNLRLKVKKKRTRAKFAQYFCFTKNVSQITFTKTVFFYLEKLSFSTETT